MNTSGMSHSRVVPAVWSVVPVTGLPMPPSAVHQPKRSGGTSSSAMAARSTPASTKGMGQRWRQRMPLTISRTRRRRTVERAMRLAALTRR